MNRPWTTWTLFGLCAALVLAAMGWVSLTALQLEREQTLAGQRAEVEERVRLALWRMDSALASLMIEESARPADAYGPIAPQSAPGLQQSESPQPGPQQATAFAASQGGYVRPPLFGFDSSNILLHFQLTLDQRLTSPQVPEPGQAATAQAKTDATARLAAFSALLRAPAVEELPAPTSLASLRSQPRPQPQEIESNGKVILRESGSLATLQRRVPPQGQNLLAQNFAINNDARQMQQLQEFRNTVEFAQRANVYEQARSKVAGGNFGQPVATPEANLGLFKPVWLGKEIVLARRVERNGLQVVQGVWLNWTNLQSALLGSVRDLFPAAALRPVPHPKADGESRLLAALPARLDPGPAPAAPPLGWTPARITLSLAWAGLLGAALAAAFLLHGALSLSERRAAFVSAVTHELRTPLTTFRMYSEMLAEDMVPDAARRRQYLETLSVEATRLSHLVENVLAYARLERGNARRREERVTLGELIERVKPRLVQRAEHAGLRLVEDADAGCRQTVVHVDTSAVEQILFNLVDNACKYAGPDSEEKLIHLEAVSDGRFALLRVRDHGQGISASSARRLFQPFSKSASEAAHSAPGVGLGLALCRKLSRSMGGELRLAARQSRGACFELLLPLDRLARASAAGPKAGPPQPASA